VQEALRRKGADGGYRRLRVVCSLAMCLPLSFSDVFATRLILREVAVFATLLEGWSSGA